MQWGNRKNCLWKMIARYLHNNNIVIHCSYSNFLIIVNKLSICVSVKCREYGRSWLFRSAMTWDFYFWVCQRCIHDSRRLHCTQHQINLLIHDVKSLDLLNKSYSRNSNGFSFFINFCSNAFAIYIQYWREFCMYHRPIYNSLDNGVW